MPAAAGLCTKACTKSPHSVENSKSKESEFKCGLLNSFDVTCCAPFFFVLCKLEERLKEEATCQKSTKPIHRIRLGAVAASVFANDTKDGTYYNVAIERSYRDGEDWKHTKSFGRDAYLVLLRSQT